MGEAGMLFMVIENFRKSDAKSIYRRFRDRGRLMPEGLAYVVRSHRFRDRPGHPWQIRCGGARWPALRP
jgi:uncharacterized glyoxalase superfamily protein PhnB